jgi:AraC family transcriptional regulator of adaptative response/methylated-DNA-[protein]-cysteine methyltransferase
MLTALREMPFEPDAIETPENPSADYERVRRIIAYISERWREQPSLDDIAAHVGLSTTHVHHLFRRWAGLSPKAFLQAITLDNAKALLAQSASVSTPPTRSACRGRRGCTISSSPTRP